MKLGVSLPKYYEPGTADPYRKTFELAQIAEDAGFDFGSVPHHSFTEVTPAYAAPFTMLAAVAARTSSLRLATAIFILPLHHPVATAEQVATLDQISNGRVILGVAAGYRDYEFAGFGLEMRHRGQRSDEILQVLREAWTSGWFEFSGKHFQIPRSFVQAMPVQRPHPPMWVGGTADGALRRAARFGDGWITENMMTLDGVAERVGVYRGFCAEAGRPPGTICLLRNGWTAPTRAEVERDWLPQTLEAYRRVQSHYRAGGEPTTDPDGLMERIMRREAVSLEEVARDRAIAGTPEDCVKQLLRWKAATGCEYVQIGLSGPGDFEAQKRTVELFGREVIPAVRSA